MHKKQKNFIANVNKDTLKDEFRIDVRTSMLKYNDRDKATSSRLFER